VLPTRATLATSPHRSRTGSDDTADAIQGPKMGEKDSREDIEKVFKLFDDDNSSKITFKNLARVAEELGETIDDEELQDMINQADRDGDGAINVDEFYRIMKKKGNFLEDLSSDDDFEEPAKPAAKSGSSRRR